MSEKVIFIVQLSDGRTVSIRPIDRAVTRFDVTHSGALIIYNENDHAVWNVAAYAAGQWAAVERVCDN